VSDDRARHRRDFGAGARAAGPLLVASFVFGLAFGAVVSASIVDPVVGAASYFIMVAGTAQFVMIDLMNASAALLVVLGAALVVNSRFALYSVALGPHYAPFPRRWKLGLAFLMTDQAAALSLRHGDEYPDPERRRWFFLGASLTYISVSWLGTIIGVITGPILPESWEISFIVPLMFVALLVPILRDRPGVVAALVAAGVVLLARDLPTGVDILLGAGSGIAAGWLIPRRTAGTRREAFREADASCHVRKGAERP